MRGLTLTALLAVGLVIPFKPSHAQGERGIWVVPGLRETTRIEAGYCSSESRDYRLPLVVQSGGERADQFYVRACMPENFRAIWSALDDQDAARRALEARIEAAEARSQQLAIQLEAAIRRLEESGAVSPVP